MDVRARLCHIRFRRQPQQQIRKRIPRENALVEREIAEIVGAAKTLKIDVSHAPHIDSKFQVCFPLIHVRLSVNWIVCDFVVPSLSRPIGV